MPVSRPLMIHILTGLDPADESNIYDDDFYPGVKMI